MIYYLTTLVDITATYRHRIERSVERNQQQNFDTVCQTIGLCGNLYFEQAPQVITSDIFGTLQKCWYFEWTMEIEHLFDRELDPIARLRDIFEYVPFITDLTESVNLADAPFFINNRNITFGFKQV